MLAQGRRKEAGSKSCGQAIQIGGADAQRDQGEHVGRAIYHRGPSSLKERPRAPQHDGRRERELNPHRRRHGHVLVQMQPRQVTSHFQGEDGGRQHGADHEATGHVLEFRTRAFGFRDSFSLQRHTADRTRSGRVPPNLRMHGAGVDRTQSHRCARSARDLGRRGGGRIQILRGVRRKFGFTAAATEVVALAIEFYAVLGRCRIDDHAAHGIMDLSRCAATGLLSGDDHHGPRWLYLMHRVF